LGPDSRAAASAAITRHLLSSPAYANALNIGAYLAFRDEADLGSLIERAHEDKKNIFVPVVQNDRQNMRFARLRPGDPLQLNRYGIAEPIPQQHEFSEPKKLHLVLVPLVAFDSRGNRLGMGAGFYDRAFAFRNGHDFGDYPYLCGVAYSCQRVPAIERRDWDVPLDLIATEEGIEDMQRTGCNG